jgi:spermidine synthase
MGGGEGSAAREALKHKSLEKVVMCDIDQVPHSLNQIYLFIFLLLNKSDIYLEIGIFPSSMNK